MALLNITHLETNNFEPFNRNVSTAYFIRTSKLRITFKYGTSNLD